MPASGQRHPFGVYPTLSYSMLPNVEWAAPLAILQPNICLLLQDALSGFVMDQFGSSERIWTLRLQNTERNSLSQYTFL